MEEASIGKSFVSRGPNWHFGSARRKHAFGGSIASSGFQHQVKQGCKGTTKAEHLVATKQRLFGKSNFRAISQGAENSGRQGKPCRF